MKQLLYSIAGLLLALSILAAQQSTQQRVQVLLETSKGKITLELYNETPAHRDAFIANVKAGSYDGVIFHRVIRDFMIQGGNLETRGLSAQAEIPDDSTAGTLPAEIMVDRFVHERGALAAARTGDEVNPEKRSSATQFYIVTGKFFTDYDLAEETKRKGIQYTADQRDAYKFRGGAPHLDGGYTVFGRLIDGWKVVDKIQRVETNAEDRPVKNVVIRKASIVEPKKK